MVGYFIDDKKDDRETISRLLSTAQLTINPELPTEPVALKDKLVAGGTDILALDFRLDEEDLKENRYKAGALAQLLREALIESPAQDFPIVLISTEENINQIYNIDKTSHDLFDQKYLKGKLSNKEYRDMCRRQLFSLASGYREIYKCTRAAGFPYNLLNIASDEWEVISPHGLLTDLNGAKGIPHVIAKLLLRQVIERPGILLSAKDVGARLGIEAENEQHEAAFNFLVDAGLGYNGIFSTGWPRIWRHNLDRWAAEYFEEPLTSIPGDRRAKTLSKIMKRDFTPAVSKWTGRPDELFAFACAICCYPTEMRNSLALYDKYLLPYVERKRACFDCIVKGALDQHPGVTIDETDAELGQRIRSGEIKRP